MRKEIYPPRIDQFETMAAKCPCDECRLSAKCRAEKLMCEAFGVYLAGSGEPRWSAAPRVPTTARFAAFLDMEKRPLGRVRKVRAERLERRKRAQRGAPLLAVCKSA